MNLKNNNKKYLLCLAILLIIIGALWWLALPKFKHSMHIKNAKSKIEYSLNDSESARYRNVRFNIGKRMMKSVCGEINAKNKFGAYTGFKKFMYFADEDLVFFETDDDFVERAWINYCETYATQKGHTITAKSEYQRMADCRKRMTYEGALYLHKSDWMDPSVCNKTGINTITCPTDSDSGHITFSCSDDFTYLEIITDK